MQKSSIIRIILFSAIFALMVSIIWSAKVFFFVQSAQRVQGTVTSVELSFDGEGDPTYNPVITYRDSQGQIKTFTTFSSFDASTFHEGDKVEVLVDHDDANHVVLNHWGELYLIPFIIGMIALLDLGAGLLMSKFIQAEKGGASLPSING